MTQRIEQVEPPLNSRRVQIPVAVALALALICAVGLIPTRRDTVDNTLPPALAIDLNSASTREISLLPGIGPILAKRIFENRERLGPFKSVADVGRVYGVGNKTVELVSPFVIIDSDRATGSPQLASVSPEGGEQASSER